MLVSGLGFDISRDHAVPPEETCRNMTHLATSAASCAATAFRDMTSSLSARFSIATRALSSSYVAMVPAAGAGDFDEDGTKILEVDETHAAFSEKIRGVQHLLTPAPAGVPTRSAPAPRRRRAFFNQVQ